MADCGRGFYLNKSMEKRAQLLQPPEMTTSIEVKESARPLIKEIQRIPRRLKKLIAKLPQQEVLCVSSLGIRIMKQSLMNCV
jgi:hypothetical protein